MKRILGVVALAAAWACGATVDAGKPGGATAPAGSIVFTRYNADTANVIDVDGTDLVTFALTDSDADFRTLPPRVAASVSSTHVRHGGHLWFVRFCSAPGVYPDGRTRRELFAVREDNGGAVQLTNDPLLAPVASWGRADISMDDGAVAFGAIRWGTDGAVQESGVYVAALSWTSSGEIAGLAESPTLRAPLPASVDSKGRLYVDVTPPQLSADRGTLVFGTTNRVSVVDTATGASANLPVQRPYGPVKLDPSGRRVAFVDLADGLHVCNVDGTGNVLLVAVTSGSASLQSTGVSNPVWSPDSAYVAYRWLKNSPSGSTESLRYVRAIAGGSAKTVPNATDLGLLLNWLP